MMRKYLKFQICIYWKLVKFNSKPVGNSNVVYGGDEFESVQVCKANVKEYVLYLGIKKSVYTPPVSKQVTQFRNSFWNSEFKCGY